jgi:uncharacterized membrane protein YuzA (DUF378 family)
MEITKKIALILLIIGGLNWGLVGLNPSWNLVEFFLGGVSWLERLIYILVGLSALLLIFRKESSKKELKEQESEVIQEDKMM